MDEHYDLSKAFTKLEELERARTTARVNGGPILLADNIIENVQVNRFEDSPILRVTNIPQDDAAAEELVFRLQGVVTDKALPPLSKSAISGPNPDRKRAHLRQAVTISGLGSKRFSKAIAAAEAIFIAFSNQLPPNTMNTWQPASYNKHEALDSHCRYFTNKRFAGSARKTSFGPLVDPEGVLAGFENDDYYPTAENQVQYYSRTSTPEGAVHIRPLSPMQIKIGDIVEITVVFMAVPVKAGKYQMISSLQGILHLDQSSRDEAAILAMKSRYTSASTQVQKLVKKRATYDVEEQQERLSKMRIDDK